MEYNRIIAITGQPGLFELISSKKDGAIVKSLEDKSVKFISSRIHNFSHLESIEIYTTGENVNLIDVLKVMDNSKEPVPSDKDAGVVKTYMQKVYPNLDFERVYSSDLKKMVKWFGILKANKVELKINEAVAEENIASSVTNNTEPSVVEAPEEEPVIEKKAPKKRAAPKKKKAE